MAGTIEGRGLEWMNETVKLSDGTEVTKWVLALTYLVVMSNLDKLNGKEKEMAKEYGNLTLEQQSKLMQEIDALPNIPDESKAKENAKELIDFIYALQVHGFITPDKRVRYFHGIQDAMKRRGEKVAK